MQNKSYSEKCDSIIDLIKVKLNDMKDMTSEYKEQSDYLIENKSKDIVRNRTVVLEYYDEKIKELIDLLDSM